SGKILFTNAHGQTDLLMLNKDKILQFRRNSVGIIFQEPMTSLNPLFTCGDQVLEAVLLQKNMDKRSAKEKTLQLFEQVKLPNPKIVFKKYPHQLSGGQKQRVMIAMAMSRDPELLICDEPTTALDVTVQKTILELIKDLQRQTAMGVIFITHDLGVVAEIADRIIVLYKGEIVEQGSMKEVLTEPKDSYTKKLIAASRLVHDNQRVSSAPSAVKFIEVEDLTVKFDNFIAVDSVSFNIHKAETLGLVGESGSGKTTLGRALLRLVKPSSGTIRFNGIDITNLKESSLRPLRLSMQLIFQDPYSSLNPRMTIGAAISEPLKVHKNLTAKERKERVLTLLEQVGLEPHHYNRYPHEFSGGQRQRIVIARALALEPSFIICDESVSALDVSIQAQVLELLNELKEKFGFTVIFISHDLAVVHYMSDRIMVMNKGRIEEIGDAEKVYRRPDSAYTQKLINSIPGVIKV
ncbi:MAG TPA: ABC transporter ATP-binding protein, partial [Chitinophagaceae bacterium]|nr:ABC transporter ATP-binding protein [Chitinophagaceae bacterium]